MKPWDQRPAEIRSLFNPAFCGLVLFRAIQGYEEDDPRGMPFSLTFLLLPLSLYKSSRETLSSGKRSYLLRVTEQNPQLLIGFAERAQTMMPYGLEAFGLLMERGCISVTDDGRIQTIPKKVKKTITGTAETIACQRVSMYLGKQFSKINDRVTIYTTFGVRP